MVGSRLASPGSISPGATWAQTRQSTQRQLVLIVGVSEPLSNSSRQSRRDSSSPSVCGPLRSECLTPVAAGAMHRLQRVQQRRRQQQQQQQRRSLASSSSSRASTRTLHKKLAWGRLGWLWTGADRGSVRLTHPPLARPDGHGFHGVLVCPSSLTFSPGACFGVRSALDASSRHLQNRQLSTHDRSRQQQRTTNNDNNCTTTTATTTTTTTT